MSNKNKDIFSGGAVAILLCLLFCMAVPLPLYAAGTLASGGEKGNGNKGEEAAAQAAAPQDDRVTYQEGFFYESLSDTVKERITGISYGEGCIVPYEELRYLQVLYMDFEGRPQVGEIICNQAIARDLAEIFYELYQAAYPIERIQLIDEYGGDDTLSMEANNTSCFNYRVVDGTSSLSKHAYGMAIDINPLYNPYVTYPNGKRRVSPAVSEIYADRSLDFPNKIDKNDLCYQLFTQHGFTWGGNWKTMKDYQHFQKALPKK